ncbi:hypothetical protein BWI92_15645 [Flectobacillus sp. BAB-3569]|nr:hypothetical protein BWI92_15645 [Flectobacillus sp. BAB-3569]
MGLGMGFADMMVINLRLIKIIPKIFILLQVIVYKDTSGDLWIETFPSIICRYNYQSDDYTRFKANQLPN